MIEVRDDGLAIDGTTHPLLSGEVHPWRIDPESWGRVLDAVAGLGFRYVACYVPWCVHETAPGSFDFTGPRDVARFIAMAGDRGLRVLVRPGPNAGAELETSGWPRRILDDPRCQALRCTGRPYLLAMATHHAFPPSYASRIVLGEIGRWYDAVCARLAPLQHPDGPVVACQVDNEMGYHFQAHPYALDYHPDAVAQYRGWLTERYGGLDGVNDAYGTTWSRTGEIDPPRDAADAPELRRVDWVEFKEVHLRRSLATLAGMLRDRGITVPLWHNDYPRVTTPMDIGALESSGAVDVAAADIYAPKEGGRYVRDLARHLAGSSKLPFLAELGAGWLAMPWLLPLAVTPLDEQHVTLRAFTSGVRAANVYMLVERDRWYASPVSRTGEVREPRGSLYRRLHAMLEELGLASMRRRAPVLLLENRTEVRRVVARSTLGGSVPCFSQLLPIDRRLAEADDAEALRLRAWETGLSQVLDEAGVDHDRAASSSLPDLTRYEAVLMPSAGACDRAVFDALRAAAAAGVRVGIGPQPPSLDERLRRFEPDPGAIVVLAEPSDAAALLPEPPFRCEHPSVDLSSFSGEGREVLAAANHSGGSVHATVRTSGGVVLTGRWEPGEIAGVHTVPVELGPWQVQVWEVHRT